MRRGVRVSPVPRAASCARDVTRAWHLAAVDIPRGGPHSAQVTDSQSAEQTPAARARRRQLINVARRRFVEDGYAQTSVAAIVKEAGVAQGTFYLYFPSKEAVLGSLRGEVLKDYLHALQRGSSGDGPADARLVRGLAEIYRMVRKHRALVTVFRQSTSGDETEKIWIEGREALAAPLAALIEEGRASGCFEVEDPRMAAHFILAMFADLLYEAIVFRKPTTGKRALAFGSRFMLRALGVTEARAATLVPPEGT